MSSKIGWKERLITERRIYRLLLISSTHGMFKYVEDLLAKEVKLEKLSHSSDSLGSIPLPEQLEDFKVIQDLCDHVG